VRREVLRKILTEFAMPMNLVRLIETYLKEAYSKVLICKNLFDAFPLQNNLNQKHILSQLILNFA
jgi:SAM-dependent MidA family methyltransferase